MKPTFILGLGAQKAGTTWLHSVLQSQASCNFGFAKEYHVWDAKFSPLGAKFVAPLPNPDKPRAAMRRLMQQNESIYASYFKSLISDDVSITGDITPSYSYLDSASLIQIRKCIDDAGFDIKVVFLMRDPVERLWSAARMQERDQAKKGKKVRKNYAIKRVRHFLETEQQVSRSNYRATIENIERVFPTEEVHFAFYEQLFNESELSKLGEFFGIEFRNVNFQKRVNASPSKTIPAKLEERMIEKLADQYQYCNNKFPITKEIWRPMTELSINENSIEAEPTSL